ncbi:MAG: histidine kinase [Limnothrix sp.]
MRQTISLPDDVIERANILAGKLGISLDELSVMALQELLGKYGRTSDADLDYEQKMKVAKRGMNKYQNALVELAK